MVSVTSPDRPRATAREAMRSNMVVLLADNIGCFEGQCREDIRRPRADCDELRRSGDELRSPQTGRTGGVTRVTTGARNGSPAALPNGLFGACPVSRAPRRWLRSRP